MPPATGGFQFQVSVCPSSSHQHQRELKAELPQTGWMCSAGASQPAAEPPQPGRPQPPDAPTSALPAKPGCHFTPAPTVQPQHRLQPCQVPARRPCPHTPAARGSPVGSRRVGAGRGHSFCLRWFVLPLRQGLSAQPHFSTQGDGEGAAPGRGRIQGTEGPRGKGCWLCLSQGKGQKAGREKQTPTAPCCCGFGIPAGIGKTFHGNRWHLAITLHLWDTPEVRCLVPASSNGSLVTQGTASHPSR